MRGSTAGLPDHIQDFANIFHPTPLSTVLGFNKKYYTFLTIVDSLLASLVVCPLVVGYWRSVWMLMDIYVLPDDPLTSAIISCVIGICGHIFFNFSQKVLDDNFHPDRNRILYYMVSRSYTVCYAFVCVNGWRGPWYLLDLHAKSQVLTSTMIGVVALFSIRGLRNVSASPCLIVNDWVKGYFEIVTMFRIPIGEKTFLYVLDCLFSVFVVGTLVVFVWRGGWIIVDILLFPDDEILSAWGSLVIGYTAVAMAFLLQPLMRYVCDRLTGSPRLLVADIFILFAFFGTVNVWRGIWNLLNLYFLPDNLELSCWITYWVSLIVLILLGCSNSLLVRGVFIDAEEPAGKCVVFPCYYLRVIFHEDKTKKLHLTSLSFDNKAQNKMDIENNHVNISTISTTMKENHSVLVA